MVQIRPQLDKINPIDFYNQYKVSDAEQLLLNKPTIKKIGLGKYTEYINKADDDIVKIDFDGTYFNVLVENSVLDKIVEKYTPFMLMQTIKFNSDFYRAIEYVKTEFFKIGGQYIRVGVDYFKEIKSKDRYSIIRNELIGWNRQSITDDLGNGHLRHVKKYDAFTIEPNNVNYRRVVENKYNLYSEPTFDNKKTENMNKQQLAEKCKWSLYLMKHVFGEQNELGLQYAKILWEQPKQILPILTLVSSDRHTAKSTFVNWWAIIMGENSVVLNPQDITSQFNGSYANKNLIIIEESKFDSSQSIEKIKNLSTQKKITVNTKFIRHHSIPFFGKIMITSNDERKFINMDDDEIRYWVRKLHTIPKEDYNRRMDEDLVNEIPYFLAYLSHIELSEDLGATRMMFTSDMIETEALLNVKKESRSGLHKDLLILLDDHCVNNPDIEYFNFIPKDIHDKWFSKNGKVTLSYLSKVLKTELKLEKPHDKPTRYYPLESQSLSNSSKTGRHYQYKNKYYKGVNNNNESQDNDSFFDVINE